MTVTRRLLEGMQRLLGGVTVAKNMSRPTPTDQFSAHRPPSFNPMEQICLRPDGNGARPPWRVGELIGEREQLPDLLHFPLTVVERVSEHRILRSTSTLVRRALKV